MEISRENLKRVLTSLKPLGYLSADQWDDTRLITCASKLHSWITEDTECGDNDLDNLLDELLYAGEHREPIFIEGSDAKPSEEDINFESELIQTAETEEDEFWQDNGAVEVIEETPDGQAVEQEDSELVIEGIGVSQPRGKITYLDSTKPKRKYTKRKRSYSRRKVGSVTRAGSCAAVIHKYGLATEPTDDMIAESDDVYAKGGGKSNLISARNCMGIAYWGIREYVRLQEEG